MKTVGGTAFKGGSYVFAYNSKFIAAITVYQIQKNVGEYFMKDMLIVYERLFSTNSLKSIFNTQFYF